MNCENEITEYIVLQYIIYIRDINFGKHQSV